MNKTLIVTLFAIAMAFLESAVVIDLRELYYPSGFGFPLPPMPPTMISIEFFRELATMVMLITLATLTGRNGTERLAWFLYSFAIWDIFYYVFLKLCIHWPYSLFEWDVLFLVPVMWTGPVWSPLLICVLMIALAILLLSKKAAFSFASNLFILAGGFICLVAFMKEFFLFHVNRNADIFDVQSWLLSGETFIPKQFPWRLFLSGYLLSLAGLIFAFYPSLKRLSTNLIHEDFTV